MATTSTNGAVDTAANTQQQTPAQPMPTDSLPQDDELEADNESSYDSDDGASETSSLKSSIIRGYIEHGRRYQTLREGQGQYYVPADDKQFER